MSDDAKPLTWEDVDAMVCEWRTSPAPPLVHPGQQAIGVRWTRNPLRALPLAESALRLLAWVLTAEEPRRPSR